jgi:hypothetical protein
MSFEISLENLVSFGLPQLPNPVHVLRFRSQGTRIELSNFGSKPQFAKGGSMRLNITAMSMAFGLLWGVCILIVAAANLTWPSYGQAFLQLCASIYPGYHPGTGIGSVVTGTIYALVDGVIGGAIFGWIYNLFAARRAE